MQLSFLKIAIQNFYNFITWAVCDGGFGGLFGKYNSTQTKIKIPVHNEK